MYTFFNVCGDNKAFLSTCQSIRPTLLNRSWPKQVLSFSSVSVWLKHPTCRQQRSFCLWFSTLCTWYRPMSKVNNFCNDWYQRQLVWAVMLLSEYVMSSYWSNFFPFGSTLLHKKCKIDIEGNRRKRMHNFNERSLKKESLMTTENRLTVILNPKSLPRLRDSNLACSDKMPSFNHFIDHPNPLSVF